MANGHKLEVTKNGVKCVEHGAKLKGKPGRKAGGSSVRSGTEGGHWGRQVDRQQRDCHGRAWGSQVVGIGNLSTE